MPKFRYAPGFKPFDEYTIECALGRGGFGEVYHATSNAGRDVALKAILKHEDTELRGVQQCMNLRSTRLLTVYDIRRDDSGTPWVVMEYVRGPSLQDIIAEYPDGMQAEQAMYLLKEIALGLSDLHNAGIVHRDLKPGNIFFDGGLAKIGDYSLSKVLSSDQQSQHTMTVGSVHYMAPEISLGRYDKTVDIYALGIIFFEMLCGRPPHTGESVGEVLMKHLNADADVARVDERFRAVIQQALERDPAERFQSAEEFAKAALASVDPSALVDSFAPATLSMIGERACNVRNQSQTGSGTTMFGVSTRSMALRSVEGRLIIGFSLLMTLGLIVILADSRSGIGVGDGLVYVCILMSAAIFPTYCLHRLPTIASVHSKGRAMLRRFMIAIGASTMFWLLSLCLTSLEPEGVFITACGMFLSLVVFDWKKVTSPARSSVLQWFPSLAAGVMSASLCRLLEMQEWWMFAGLTAFGLTLGIQTLSPFPSYSSRILAPGFPDRLASWLKVRYGT